MHDAGVVRGRQGPADLCRELRDPLRRQPAPPGQAAHGPPREQRHDQVGDFAVRPVVEDGHDVRAVQCGGGPRLPPEHGEEPLPLGAGRARRQAQQLDGDRAFEPGVPGPPHHTHTARTDPLRERVPAVQDRVAHPRPHSLKESAVSMYLRTRGVERFPGEVRGLA